MARTLTPLDGYAIINEMVRQGTGQKALAATDISSFVSAGETLLASGVENVMNTLSLVIGRTFVATRPYKAKFSKVNAISTDAYTNRLRKISYYSRDAKASGYFNTDQFKNLANGFTNGQNEAGTPPTPQSTKSMWEQETPIVAEFNFAGSTVWDVQLTRYEKQIRAAFRGPQELADFVNGIITEKANDIESEKEAWNRMAVLSKIASVYNYAVIEGVMTESAVNLTAAFNAFYGTSYSTADLQSTYLKEFLAFMVATIKEYSDYLTERSARFHLPMTKTVDGVQYSILRHTPKDRQRLYLYQPLFRKAESLVLPEIFHDEMLDIDKQYEGVNFWQNNESETTRPSISLTTAIYDVNTGAQKQGSAVSLDYVVGMLTDEDGILTDFQMDGDAYTTPVEARKGYRNTWWHFSKNIINDPTENCIIFYMKD